MKHIITVQHTQSIHHTNGMVGSWTDWDLTELGKIQADHIGKKLNNELAGKKVVLYSSDLKRAIQTAEEIAKYLGIEPIFKQELRERNLGKCCGKSVQWLRENIECPENTVDDRLFSDGIFTYRRLGLPKPQRVFSRRSIASSSFSAALTALTLRPVFAASSMMGKMR